MIYFILYKIGCFIAMTLPVNASYRFASFLASIKYFVSLREKRYILENLKVIFPNEDLKVLKKYPREIFKNFSKYLVDFLRFEKMDLAYITEQVEFVNRNYLDEALKKGKGAVLLTAHLGTWELGGAVMAVLGYPVNVIALEHRHKAVNDFFVKQRERKNEKVIPISVALRRCFSALRNNEVLGIVGDKDFTNTGELVEFFGKYTLMPKGPAALSLKTGATIIPGFAIRVYDDHDHFQLILEKPIEYSPTGNHKQDVVDLMNKYLKVLEDYIRRYPTQWYCFRKVWV